MVLGKTSLLARLLCSRRLLLSPQATLPSLASFGTSRLAAMPHRIKGQELFGAPLDVDKAFPQEEHKRMEAPVQVDLETEHARVEDPEVPMLSSLWESHAPPREELSGEEAVAEVERLRKLVLPMERDI